MRCLIAFPKRRPAIADFESRTAFGSAVAKIRCSPSTINHAECTDANRNGTCALHSEKSIKRNKQTRYSVAYVGSLRWTAIFHTRTHRAWVQSSAGAQNLPENFFSYFLLFKKVSCCEKFSASFCMRICCQKIFTAIALITGRI